MDLALVPSLSNLLLLPVLFLPGFLAGWLLTKRSFDSLLLAPVLTLGPMAMVRILGSLLLEVPVTRTTTIVLWVLYVAVLAPLVVRARPWVRSVGRVQASAWNHARLAWWGLGGIVLMLVVLTHYAPHMAIPEGDHLLEQGARYGNAILQRDDVPFPVHVDSYTHLATQFEILRTGDVFPPDPYTGAAPGDYFSVNGVRSDRGFDLSAIHIHHFTDVPLLALARLMPALWAGMTAVLLARTMPTRFAGLAALALVAILPTTPRFLGVGYYVPSSFASAWIPATILLLQTVEPGKRLIGVLALTGPAPFMHLTVGPTAVLAGILHTLDEEKPFLPTRLIPFAIPLLLVGPVILLDLYDAGARIGSLPFEPQFLSRLGVGGLLLVLALGYQLTQPAGRRTYALLATACFGIISVAVLSGTTNHGVYDRMFYGAILGLAGAGAMALGTLVEQLGVGLKRLQATAPPVPPARTRLLRAIPLALGFVLLVAMVSGGVQANLTEPHYRVHTSSSFQATETLVLLAEQEPDAIFLSEPWQAMLYAGVSGLEPVTVLSPGAPPPNGTVWAQYARDRLGAPLLELDVRFVVGPAPVDVPSRERGPGVHELVR